MQNLHVRDVNKIINTLKQKKNTDYYYYYFQIRGTERTDENKTIRKKNK